MNIFYFFKELDTPMYQWQRTNLIDELIRNGHKVKTFNPLDYQSIEEANAITVPSIKKWGKCDLFLTCDDQDTIFKETVEEINLKSASNLNGNLNCSKELEHYAS